MILFQGEAKKFSISITDSVGAAVDPATFDNVRVWLYDQRTETTFGQYSLDPAETEYDTAEIESGKVVFYVTATQSAAATEGKAVIQVSMYSTYLGAQDLIDTKKGVFAIVKPAKQ
jgi:hypothetical protein